ncbi:RHS repeat-associated core domain-containing protein [Paenibacillus faecalis]|uniref:RHS repeat-associated core domain-containing protein n=1 Tax=Paenibacillus faecalis TaxID=2079532 RepID=UPI000D0E83A3
MRRVRSRTVTPTAHWRAASSRRQIGQPFAYNRRDGVQTDKNGLQYMRARYYHSELKRFLNRDILRGDITSGLSMNRYAYVNGNPGPAGVGCDSGGEGWVWGGGTRS